MHNTTFEYLKPSEKQKEAVDEVRKATYEYYTWLRDYLPEGPDKTYTIRKLREVAMWANVALTREVDGSPRI